MRLKPLPFNTLLDALHTASQATTGIHFLSWENVAGPEPAELFLTWGQLEERALGAATQLRAQGVLPGSFVLLILPNGLDFVTTFLAVLMAGATPVPFSYPVPFDDPDALLWTMERIRERTGDGVLVQDAALMERWAQEPRLAGVVRMAPPDGNAAALAAEEVAKVAAEDLALVQFTSGSTGHPKGVMLSHANLLANCAGIAQAVQAGPKDVTVTWLPLCHDMGLIGTLLTSMCQQMTVAIMTPFEFVMDPARWVWAIHRFRGSVCTAPNFGYALLARPRRGGMDVSNADLSCWRVAMCGAEPVSADVLQRFVARYEGLKLPPHAPFPVYGLAEASLAVSFPAPGSAVVVDHVDRNALSDARRAIPSPAGMPWTVGLTGLGHPIPGHRVRIEDDQGKPRADREVGEICVRGPSVTRGYLRDDAATQAILDDGWLHTGDLGYLVEGQLFVCGRKKDVIIFRGRKYYPQDLERVAGDVDGVRKGNVVAFGDMDPGGAAEQVCVVLEARDNADGLGELVKAKVQECTGVPVERVVVLGPGELPKTPSGKVRRALCKETWGRTGVKSPVTRPA